MSLLWLAAALFLLVLVPVFFSGIFGMGGGMVLMRALNTAAAPLPPVSVNINPSGRLV